MHIKYISMYVLSLEIRITNELGCLSLVLRRMMWVHRGIISRQKQQTEKTNNHYQIGQKCE
jgi:hypothetical protein